MLGSCLFDRLDYILPRTDESNHDILRLEYLCACKLMKLMENKDIVLEIVPKLPVRMFELLLQSLIYESYLKYIYSGNIPEPGMLSISSNIDISFPESLGILILNWPYEELILRSKIPPLHPPVEIFPSDCEQLASVKQNICQVEDMSPVFIIFCNRLIQFITQAVFKGTHESTYGVSCNLRRLDVSGLGCFHVNESESFECFSRPDDILRGILNSKIDIFGHKIDIFTDALIDFRDSKDGFELLRNIVEESLNPAVGISVYFKTMVVVCFNPDNLYSSEFYKVMALARCEYLQINGSDFNQILAENLYTNLPELVGIAAPYLRIRNIDESLNHFNFLSSFKYLEQVSFGYISLDIGLTNSISNMSKGLKYLKLSNCSLHCKDLECLANSKHSDTLLQLDLSNNNIRNDSDGAGLITLCQKLKNIKVLIVDDCSLDKLSSDSVSKLINAFKDFELLELLSMTDNPFSLKITNIIIDGLATRKSLRYLSLSIPVLSIMYGEDDENFHVHDFHKDLYKTFHEKMNKCRHSPIYISWSLYIYLV